jgi:hypothetical protein
MQAPASRPQPYKKSDKLKFLGAYGETDDMTAGSGRRALTRSKPSSRPAERSSRRCRQRGSRSSSASRAP